MISKSNPLLRQNKYLLNQKYYFLLILLTNFILSYSSWPVQIKFFLGIFGLGIPLFLIYRGSLPTSQPLYSRELFPPPKPWVLGGLALLALALRFYHLTTLTVWPHFDEATTGYYGMALSQKWDPRLFYEDSQSPPGYLWGLGVFFKLFGVSLCTLWFYPAMLSFLTVPVSFLAARQFISKSFSTVLALGMGFSFWPLYTGRFSLMAILVLFWECLVLFIFGKFLKSSTSALKTKEALMLGCATGLGFYTGLHWIVIAGVISLTLLIVSWKKNRRYLVVFSVPAVLFLSPLFFAAFQPGYGKAFQHLSSFHQPLTWNHQIQVSLSYVTALFWGLDPGQFTFQPVFGGFLNPVLTSTFFLGLILLFRSRTLPLYRWLGVALFLFILPGLLTKDCEPLRIIPILPILLAVAALGIFYLLSICPPQKRFLLLAVMMSLSFGLDFYHLNVRYHRLWDFPGNWKGYAKSMERYRAYGILEKIRREDGPGLIFSNFTTGLCDQSLSIADYSFNAVENPGISRNQIQWVALLTNVNYRPFLDHRFGPSQAFALSKDMSPVDGGLMLWVTPLTKTNRKDFFRWWLADRSLRDYIDANLSHVGGQTYLDILPALVKAWPSFKDDPLLESCYWEKTAELFVKEGLLNRQNSDPLNLSKGMEYLKMAADVYPAAHLYNHLGNLYLLEGKRREAQKYFRLALKSPLNLTNSSHYLGEN